MKVSQMGIPIKINDITLIPVETTWFYSETRNKSFQCYGGKQASAIVVCTADELMAFDVKRGRVPMETMKRELPGLPWNDLPGGQV